MKFITKVNLPCVNQGNGVVPTIHIQIEPAKLSILRDWKNQYTLEHILVALKNEMINNRKLPQPAEGNAY